MKNKSWTYDYSPDLGLKIAYRQTPYGPEVMTEDKINYSPAEIRLLSSVGGITLQIHNIKKVFHGEIVDIIDKHSEDENEIRPPKIPDAETEIVQPSLLPI